MNKPASGTAQLSDREREIAEAYADGASYHQIAERLCIAPSTVRTHLSTVFRKLNVSSKLDLHKLLENAQRNSDDYHQIQTPLPEKPSIAVLAFENMSGDPEQEYFSDGISEDIITALSRSPWLFIIARNTTFTYKGEKLDVRHIAEELGVKYVLEGSVRRAGDRIRVTAQLIDGTTGGHIWSERYDGQLEDVFDLQDEITRNVVASIQTRVHLTASGPVERSSRPDLTVWELTMRAWHLLYDFTPESFATATTLLQRALEHDPESAEATLVMSLIHHHSALMGYAEDFTETMTLAHDLGRRATRLDERNEYAHWAYGISGWGIHKHDASIAALERAVELNPNCSLAYGSLGTALALVGRLDEAIANQEIAIRSNPRDPSIFFRFSGIAFAKYLGGDFDAAAYATYAAAREAADWVRQSRRPAFLHLTMVRLYGHAGADVPTSYLSRAEVEADEAQDPLLHSVRLLEEAGALPRREALAIYEAACEEVAELAREAARRPRLETAEEVAASLIPPRHPCRDFRPPDEETRRAVLGSDVRALSEPQPMGRLINLALHDLMMSHRETVLMGEDIGRKGGVYGVTQKLQARFGPDRVIDTLLDETSILGLAIGLAHNGFIPVPEIQFLAYFHNAEDQIRGEAATLPFFSQGAFTNPMVLRIAGLGYQKGFGGHFHNDNSLAVLRDIPGLILACPSRGDDAVRMLRECHRLAREEQRVVVFLEPIALYAQRDLHAEGDGGWMARYPDPGETVPLGEVGVTGEGSDLAIVSYGNGHRLALQAAARLGAEGVATRVIDLRWLAPLPEASLLAALEGARRVLVVDECRRSGNVSEGLMTLLYENAIGPAARLTATDSFIATGPAHAATLPSAVSILDAARGLLKNGYT